HRDRLLVVVGQVLPLGRETGERAVVSERADRLRAGGGHLLHQLHVLALPDEAAQHSVLDLDRLRGAGARVAGDLGALERTAGRDRLREALVAAGLGAPAPAPAADALQGVVVAQLGLALAAIDRHEQLLARRQWLWLLD